MIERIIESSIRNRFLVLAVAAALTLLAIHATIDTPIDAIPDLSENQVIVFADWIGRSPREIEDQVTYPLSRKLQGLAGVRTIRSSSEFNFSMITIIFEDGVDFYFARQRVSEKLSQANLFLPPGVVPYLAPDATSLGQIYWYTVETRPHQPMEPGRLWALNKFYIAPVLNAAAGVADVAIVGGAPLEYQVDVRPEDLRAYGITLGELYRAVAESNMPSAGGVVQKNNAEYIVRGVGWIQGTRDIEETVVKEVSGIPVYVRNVASVQLGTQFRRSVFEKNGSEVTGGTVLMRHGENPLEVTARVREKIQELKSGLPEGVHIVPAYDRTRLIRGAIHTLTEVMWHEMAIASLAILLILMHVRSVLVICVTLPLAVLFSFLLMWTLRQTGIVDIQANIMSLAGITISIGVLVDQAIVMTENATHHLTERFGDRRVTGDIREPVIEACRRVGRPIFFSVMIMLLSFIPVFMLSGREGKLFHPLAFTKSFAMVGVALISVTVVPALLPTFLKGRLRGEEENWIVRSLINIYRPLLTWALPRRNLVMWVFAVLLILAAGIFPLQAILGQGASETAWKAAYLSVFAAVTSLTVCFTRRWYWQLLSMASLIFLGVWAWHFPKIGVSFMPPLDEGTTLDMPVTVPRISVTQAADDLKARNALLRGFPEVESVIGKAGRAETPTDPAPLDMVETFVNYRPRELWPKRVLRYADAARQAGAVLDSLASGRYVTSDMSRVERDNLLVTASQKALERFDEAMRELALLRYTEFERELEARMTRLAVHELYRRLRGAGLLHPAASRDDECGIDELAGTLAPKYGYWLARSAGLEDATELCGEVVRELARRGGLSDPVAALQPQRSWLDRAAAFAGAEPPTLARQLLDSLRQQHARLWRERVREINRELLERGVGIYTWYALEEIAHTAREMNLLADGVRGDDARRFVEAATNAAWGGAMNPALAHTFSDLRADLEAAFGQWVLLWPRQPGPRGDLVDDEMGRVLQVPGWSNIFTQPIINRIEMLSTGVRTDIGVKVFGPDLESIDRVCKEIEAVLRPLSGARDVLAAPIMGKGYIQIDIRRDWAARYGISVANIQNEIEMALAGKTVTYSIEKRDRFPIRLRYARVHRGDEESIRRLLIGAGGMSAEAAGVLSLPGESRRAASAMERAQAVRGVHAASPPHAPTEKPFIPLSAVAEVNVVEGPAMIKSENGRLLNYVTLNVRGRDIVGFVDEARRAVSQKVIPPPGVHIEWSGEFEHQTRAARTLRFVLPAVIAVIFLILYLTYNDLADALLMMLAVPEALAGGALFMYMFPKLTEGMHAPPMDFSVAVWIGFIACFGMATETGIIMLVYLREAIEKRGGLENISSLEELRQAVIEGAVHRLRPKLLTEGVAIIAIFPMVFAKGVGAEILAPMALPVLGGLLVSDEVVDLFLPVRFYWVRRARWLKLHASRPTAAVESAASLPAVTPA